MLGLLLYGGYFLLLACFFVFVYTRLDMFSGLLAYVLIIFPSFAPFVFIVVDQRREEKKKAELSEKKNSGHG